MNYTIETIKQNLPQVSFRFIGTKTILPAKVTGEYNKKYAKVQIDDIYLYVSYSEIAESLNTDKPMKLDKLSFEIAQKWQRKQREAK